MALSAIVTKKAVNYVQEKMHNIVFNLKLSDDTKNPVEVINKDFTCQYQPGQSPESKVSFITKEMQLEINRYKSEQVIFNASALDTAVINIKNGLIL